MMYRETIVKHVQARDKVIVWTATDLGRYWLYRPGPDRVEAVSLRGPVPAEIQVIACEEGLKGGIWVHGIAGISALFETLFGGAPQYYCYRCCADNDADVTAEWMLLAKLNRDMEESEFMSLHTRLTHPKRQNESDTPVVVMTAEEEKFANELLKQHFEEDRPVKNVW